MVLTSHTRFVPELLVNGHGPKTEVMEDKTNGMKVCAGQVVNNSVRTLTSALSEANSHYLVFSQAVIWCLKSLSYVCLSSTSFQERDLRPNVLRYPHN